jgi:hypothetical protein
MAERPRLLKVDAEMQRWCALLEDEVLTWPDVSVRPMFGMRAFYRGPTIFAALPRTRAMGTSSSILLKLPRARGEKVIVGRAPGAKWTTFHLESEADVPEALRLIGEAFAAGAVRRTTARRRRGHR